MVMLDRRDAGGIGVALFRQYLMRPRCALVDGEARCAVTGNQSARRVFNDLSAAFKIIGELLGRECENAVMAVTVARQFMPRTNNPPHERRITFGDPA